MCSFLGGCLPEMVEQLSIFTSGTCLQPAIINDFFITYLWQIHIPKYIYKHGIFAVKGREALIRREWQDEWYRYMAGALKNHGHTPYIINGVENHVHLLFGMTPKEALSEWVQSLKISR